MWGTLHERIGFHSAAYQVVQSEPMNGKNLLLVPSEDVNKFASTASLRHDWRTCIGALDADGASKTGAPAKRDPVKFIRFIDFWCGVTNTPYYLEVNGTCCPTEVNGKPLNLGNTTHQSSTCRCSLITDEASYQRGGRKMPPRRPVRMHDHR